jgi:hypothetical protein
MVTITTNISDKNIKDLEKFCQKTNSYLTNNQKVGNNYHVTISLNDLNVDKFSKLKKDWDLKNENIWQYRKKKLLNLLKF